MPTIISPIITDAGLAAAINANANGLQVAITHVALGTGQYLPSAGQPNMLNRKEKVTISGGQVSGLGGFNLNVLFPSWTGAPNPYNATELGFWAGDPDAGGVLFAVYSHPSSVIVQRNALDYVASFGMQLSRVPSGSVAVTIDPGGSQALALISAHEEDLDPHATYAKKAGIQAHTYSSSTATGSADAIVAAFVPVVSSLVNGMSLSVRATSANASIAPTFTPGNGVIAAKIIVKSNGLPLLPGDITGAGHWLNLQYDQTLDKWVLLNPAKLIEIVSVSDFAGYDKTGTVSSVAAINAALAASKHVIVPAGHTPLIDSTITVPDGKTLEFKGAPGNPAVNPGSYFIKKATMTTVGIILNECSALINGGLVCQPGNTGGGIVLARNAAKAIRPFVSHAGGVGIRVGTDAGDNSNNTELIHPVSVSNGSHGIYVHDGFGDDANAGVIQQPVCIANGGDGVRIGHAYWVTVIAGNCEINAGWGLYLSGANRATYPEARWVNVIGGDYNEGNSLGAVHDASYFSTFTNADSTNFPTTAPNGLQGSAQRTYVGGSKSIFASIETYRSKSTFNAGDDFDPIVVRSTATGSVGDGAGIKFEIDRSGTGAGPFVSTAHIKSWSVGAVDGLMFRANNAAGVMEAQVIMTPYYGGTVPGADNARILGHPALRWSTVYAASSAINTSDARCKQQWDTDLAPELKAWAKVNFGKFKFNDAVALKGDSARWHFGVIAQQVKEAFESEGLDPFKYGVLCYDEWEEMPAQIDADGSEVASATPAGSRFGVRYDEALALECAYLRSKLA